ncbi:hypothetical protein [Streptomyces pseudovenezuelae]|uniref:Uncharacterized protein n=1 Tax=Streptomyces pseudovenezuelae TaxID=67350 RepID=A0ABT6LMP8_9ACTN|nr:hypothetical protein [Streptomyces pseudovenezuelae]MDH6217084.1 hypothetical protein [Streptomyces pseudovenezuelae]
MTQSHEAIEPFEAPEALLITGEALRDMTPEHLDALSHMLGGLGLRMTAIANPEGLSTPESKSDPDPVLASKTDFLQFAEETGRTSRLATMAWNMAEATEWRGDRLRNAHEPGNEHRITPLIFSSDEDGNRYVDLHTIGRRLFDSGRSWDAWSMPAQAKISFLDAICEAKLVSDPAAEEE